MESHRRGGEVPGAQSREPESTSADGGVPRGRRQVKRPKKGMSGFQFKIPTALAPSTLLVSPNYQ